MLSAATLAFEINLTRLFSVTQFYHFAFMIVSVALLGFGASGTFLALFPKFGQRNPAKTVSRLCIASGMFMLASYLLLNWLPFDSFSISVDRRQVVILTINYLILAAPFLFSGMAVALLLKTSLEHVGAIYAINLAGSACGCILALIWPTWMGGEGTSIMASCLAGLAALPAMIYSDQNRWSFLAGSSALTILVFYVVGELLFYASTGSYTSFLELHISPYKGLSYILQYPDAMIVSRRWNSYSVVDRVRSDSIRSLPGLSYRYNQLPPAQDGLLVDGDELSPIILAGASTDYADYMPAALAFHLQPEAEVLVLEPRGGLDISTALSLGARRVTAVEVNPLIIEAAGEHYNNRRVQVIHGTGRSFLRQTSEHYDIAMISLINTYHPVRSGAYSLTEDYRNTIEAFQDGLARLKPEGILVVTRWLQSPPSEFLRAFATCLTALENIQASPKTQLIAYRGYQTGTILVKKSAFTPDELQATRDFLAQRGFDLVYAPDIRGDETNRFNILPESVYMRFSLN
jgi:spermidine synthase